MNMNLWSREKVGKQQTTNKQTIGGNPNQMSKPSDPASNYLKRINFVRLIGKTFNWLIKTKNVGFLLMNE
jgi:hypothetical protein